MRVFKCILWSVLYLLIGVISIIAGFLAYLTWTDYQPKPMEELSIKGSTGTKADPGREFSMLTWNIGYAGLGQEMDFFYDGGIHVRPELSQYQSYLNGVYNIVTHADTLDFILLQEVDIDAKRSYFINQADLITNALPSFIYSYAINYNVKYIPFPILKPMGKVKAGLLTLSRFQSSESVRISSPKNFAWPKRTLFLDRCWLMMRFPLIGGKDLLVVNIHLSAWDEGVALRKEEIRLVEEWALKEYNQGNYIIVGGDWNQSPPCMLTASCESGDLMKKLTAQASKSILNNEWKYVFDARVPTNRDVDKAYQKGRTKTSIIDYFLVSPNIQIREIKTLYNGFAFSDHHPVYLRVRLGVDSLTSNYPIPLPQ
jgi:endonuclease/exonuclease/phosphatase family metal-dependent hydrolase